MTRQSAAESVTLIIASDVHGVQLSATLHFVELSASFHVVQLSVSFQVAQLSASFHVVQLSAPFHVVELSAPFHVVALSASYQVVQLSASFHVVEWRAPSSSAAVSGHCHLPPAGQRSDTCSRKATVTVTEVVRPSRQHDVTPRWPNGSRSFFA